MKAKAPRRSPTPKILRGGETKAFAGTAIATDTRAQPQPFLVHTLPLRVRKAAR